MDKEELRSFIKEICAAAKESVDCYTQNSGQNSKQMPEYVMSAGVAMHLAKEDRPCLEMDVFTLCKEFGRIDEVGIMRLVEKVKLRRGRIDLTVLSKVDEADNGRPIGFIEFKKWERSGWDESRLKILLKHIPRSAFGASLILTNSSDKAWRDRIRNELGETGFCCLTDLVSVNENNQPCYLLCIVHLPRANRTLDQFKQ